RRLWVMEGLGGTLVVLDGHAVREYLYGLSLFEAVEQDTGARESGLGGGTICLPTAQRERLLESRPLLERMAIEIQAFGGDSLALHALPPMLLGADLPTVLGGLASVLPSVPKAVWLLACHAAEVDTRETSPHEVSRLLAKLDSAPAKQGARHERIILLEVPQF